MPTTLEPTTVVTHAVTGSRDQVIRWFARHDLVPDVLLVAEQRLRVDGHVYVDRYVGHEERAFRCDPATYDFVIDLGPSSRGDSRQ